MIKYFGCILMLGLCSLQLKGNGEPVHRISENFTFDGIIQANEWDEIPEVELIVSSPNYKADPTERTVIKIAYDENFIYLMGELYSKDISKIHNKTKLRDGGDGSTDYFGMIIDSYNDKQNGLCFFTTPSGSRWDAAILNDAQRMSSMNLSWNNFWDVKTSQNEEGWFVEMRVPFTSLQYQPIDGKVTMGINIWRYIAHHNEVHISPDIPPDAGDMGIFRPSLAKEYIFEGLQPKKPFYIIPYVLGGINHENHLNRSESAYEADDQLKGNVGLDVKYGITNNFTLDLSFNTDFAQVEVDDQQINLTRFSLFFPEKRLFFQERSGIFNFSLGQRNNLFYSRRIGIDDDGNAIPILGGARLTGRSGDLDIGLITMQTQKFEDISSTNYSVFRTKKRVLNEFSDAGFLLTNTIDANGYYNTVYGFDTNLMIGDDVFLNLKAAQAITEGVNFKPISADPSAFWISLSRRSTDGFTYGGSLSRLGADFDSNLAFLDRVDYTRLGTRLNYNWFPKESTQIFQHGPFIRGVSYWDNATNIYNNAFYSLGYSIAFRKGTRISFSGRMNYDYIIDAFELAGEAEVPIGSYAYYGLNTEFITTNSLPYFVMGNISIGQFFDGWRTGIALAPTYNISSSLSLSGTYEYNHVEFNTRNEEFTAHIARLKALIMFSTKLSISSFIQYNSLDHLFFGNIRLRYNPREGVDLFVVYNTDANSYRSLESPRLPLTNQSSLVVKYTYTFTL